MPANTSRHGTYDFLPVPVPDQPEPKQSKCPSGYAVAVFAFIMAILFAGGVVLGYFLRQGWDGRGCREEAVQVSQPTPRMNDHQQQDAGDRLRQHERIRDLVLPQLPQFSNISEGAILSSSEEDERILFVLGYDKKIQQGIDYPELRPGLSNTVQVLKTSSGEALQEMKPVGRATAGSAFVDFTVDGSVEGGLVYIRGGLQDDYIEAKRHNVDVSGKIALVWISNSITVVEQMKTASLYGVKALLLFENLPQEQCGPTAPTLSGWQLHQQDIPIIVVQTISCQDARQLLQRMSGVRAPASWQGSMQLTYYIGPPTTDKVDWKVNVTTKNDFNSRPGKTVTHIFRNIVGNYSAEKFVLVGTSRTSIYDGQGQRNSRMLLQLYETLATLKYQELWVPRRTIRFVWWAGNDFGPVGTAQFVKEYAEAYRENVLAYVHLEDVKDNSMNIYMESTAAFAELLESKIRKYKYDMNKNTDCKPETQSTAVHRMSSGLHTCQVVQSLLNIPVLLVSTQSYPKSKLSLSKNPYCMDYDMGLKTAGLFVLSVVDAGVFQTNLVKLVSRLSAKQKSVHAALSNTEPGFVNMEELDHMAETIKNLMERSKSKRDTILSSDHYHEEGYRRAANAQIIRASENISKAAGSLDRIRTKLEWLAKYKKAQSSRSGDENEWRREVTGGAVQDLLVHSQTSVQNALHVLQDDVY